MLQHAVFDDFSGGDSGRSRPASQLGSPANTFRGVNCWTYPSGGIGPRPPFQPMRFTGLPLKKLNTYTTFRGTDNFVRTVFSFDDGTVYMGLSTFGTAMTLIGTVTPIPTAAASFGDGVYFVSNNAAGGAKLTAAGVLTAIPAMPQGHLIIRFGQQAVVAQSASPTNTIRWSDLNDFTTWPVGNTLPVGDDLSLVGMYLQRNSLILPKVGGEVWGITGVLGVNETLRRLDVGVRHLTSLEAFGAVVNQSNLWFPSNQVLGKFTGAQLVPEPRPDVPLKALYSTNPWHNNPGSISPCIGDDEFLLVGTLDKLSNGAIKTVWVAAHRPDRDNWTRHLVPVTDFLVTGAGVSTGLAVVRVSDYAHDGVSYFCTMSDTLANAGRAPSAYAMFSAQEFPLVPNGTFYSGTAATDTLFDADSGAPVVAEFQSQESWSPTGSPIRVRSVLVDYSYAPAFTPFSTYNRFDISVEALQNAGSVAVQRSTVQAFTPPASGSTPDGAPLVRGQARFQMGDQGAGVGFRVRLDDWRGIVVHRITVIADEAPTRF